ncbi:hypothetical protein DNTS_012498 [Danionella cerebrum]|uniref:Uncharacterized protein n=1 Tax=Danionella cerebrum TaxID=2873325 RepID=A0A553QZY7_9TELE|nr:hypothetical protein DNTS_012498 [Danionella translucida]
MVFPLSHISTYSKPSPLCWTDPLWAGAISHSLVGNGIYTSNNETRLTLGNKSCQKSLESVFLQAQDQTLLSLQQCCGGAAQAPLEEFFTDVALFTLGSEINLENSSRRFLYALFPWVYLHLIEPSFISPSYSECLRSASPNLAPFGSAPLRLASQISRATLPSRVFLQALHLGIEVINTTENLQVTRECKRALLRMNYCPLCQAQGARKPCMGYCLNVMRGCLASLAEVDSHWREFVGALEGLSNKMELEQGLIGAQEVVREALSHAQKSASRISSQVQRVCGHLSRGPDQVSSVQHKEKTGPHTHFIPLRASSRNTDESLSSRRKEFLSSLRVYRTFYGALADQLCVAELASADGSRCWSGSLQGHRGERRLRSVSDQECVKYEFDTDTAAEGKQQHIECKMSRLKSDEMVQNIPNLNQKLNLF